MQSKKSPNPNPNIKTKVLGIETSTEHAPLLDDILQHAFPLSHDDKESFVSYRAKIDDARLWSLYHIQNKWLAQVKVVKIGGDRNIDKRFHVGLLQPVCLRDFIRNQPADPNNSHHAMDADNGGKDGKPVIIVMPKYLKATKDTYDNFHTLTKQFQAATLHQFDSVPSPPDTDDISPDSYDAKMTAFLDMMPPSTNSDSDDCSNANNSSPFSASSSNTRSKGCRTPPSNTLSVPAQSSSLS
jgi:hypothetical protein